MKCVICKLGETQPGRAIVTLQRGDRTLVMKGIPAEICENCGEYYLSDQVAQGIYRRAEESLKLGEEAQGRRAALTERAQFWHQILKYSTLGLSAIGLLAHILGVGKLAYDVIVLQEFSDLAFKSIVLVITLLFGIGVGFVNLRGFPNPYLFLFARYYAWVYVAMVCISYLGIAMSLYGRDYSLVLYWAYVAVVLVELFAIYALHVGLNTRDTHLHSIPLLAVCIIHVLMIVYAYVFASVRVSIYLAGDLAFFTGMTLMGSAMLGDFGFAAMLSKIGDESYKNVPEGVRQWLETETSFQLGKTQPRKESQAQGDKKLRDEKKA